MGSTVVCTENNDDFSKMKVSNDEAKFNTTKFTSDLLLEHEVANLTVMAADMDERVVLSLLPCTSYNSLRELVCCQLNRNYKVRVKHAYGGLTDDMLIHKLNPKGDHEYY